MRATPYSSLFSTSAADARNAGTCVRCLRQGGRQILSSTRYFVMSSVLALEARPRVGDLPQTNQ
eukprot:365333-Chlamydomonas_euryale.AAC.12